MYLWKVDSLVEDLKTGKVTQKEELKYMLLFTMFFAFASDPVLYAGYSYNYYDTICYIVYIGISMLGTYYCFKINSSGDNKDFILRVMCIGLPVAIRVLALLFSVACFWVILKFFIFAPQSIEEEVFESSPIEVGVTSIFTAIYYWYLSKKIKAVSSKKAE